MADSTQPRTDRTAPIRVVRAQGDDGVALARELAARHPGPGIDLRHRFLQGRYELTAKVVGSRVTGTQHAIAATQQSSSEAREAFQLAQLRFTRGLTTQLEVSDAQLALLVAQSFEARATYDLFLASADLARALGRPIPLPPMSTTPSAPR